MRKLPLVLILLTAFLCTLSNAQTSSDQAKRKAKLEKEIDILDGQLKDNASKSSSALSRLTLISGKVAARKKLLSESEKELAALDDRIQVKKNEVEDMQARMDTLESYYSKLVRSAYRNRDPRIWYMYIFASSDLSQGVRRYSYLKNMSSRMAEEAVRIKDIRSQLDSELVNLEKLREEAGRIRDARAAEVSALKKDEASSAMVVAQLKKEKTRYQKLLASKKNQMDALNRELNRMIGSVVGGGKSKGTAVRKTVDTALSKEFSSNKGKLPWPVDGVIVDRFGQHYHPVYQRVKLPFNNGVTVAVSKDASVHAVFDGVVKQIVVMPGYNQCVLVQHGEYFTFYCKLKSVSVKAGEKVRTGQKLGVVDTIDNETQLHFQLWKERTPQDPEKWLK